MDKVQSIQNQSQIPKNGQASGKFSDSGPSNPPNSDRLWADFGPSNPQNRGQPYIGASGGLVGDVWSRGLATVTHIGKTQHIYECPQLFTESYSCYTKKEYGRAICN